MDKKYEYSRVFKYDSDKVHSPKNILIKYVADNGLLLKLGIKDDEYSEKDITNIISVYSNLSNISDNHLKNALDTIYDIFVIAQIITDISYKEKSSTIANYWYSRTQYDDLINDLKKQLKYNFSSIKFGIDLPNIEDKKVFTKDGEKSVETNIDDFAKNLSPEQLEAIKKMYSLK